MGCPSRQICAVTRGFDYQTPGQVLLGLFKFLSAATFGCQLPLLQMQDELLILTARICLAQEWAVFNPQCDWWRSEITQKCIEKYWKAFQNDLCWFPPHLTRKPSFAHLEHGRKRTKSWEVGWDWDSSPLISQKAFVDFKKQNISYYIPSSGLVTDVWGRGPLLPPVKSTKSQQETIRWSVFFQKCIWKNRCWPPILTCWWLFLRCSFIDTS